MTKINLLSLSSLLILLTLASCSNKEQEEEAARATRREQQELADRQHQEEVNRLNKAAEPQPETAPAQTQEETPAEPEQPAEPETVTAYQVELQGQRNNITCEDINEKPCGYSLERCSDGKEYRCITNFKFTEVQVPKKD